MMLAGSGKETKPEFYSLTPALMVGDVRGVQRCPWLTQSYGDAACILPNVMPCLALVFFGYCRSLSLPCSDFLVDVIVSLENKHYVTSAWGFCKR